jgi:hypothetical protein
VDNPKATGGQATLTLTAGPEVFGGRDKYVVVINAKTGMPISSWMGEPGRNDPRVHDTYQVSRMTVANIKSGKL